MEEQVAASILSGGIAREEEIALVTVGGADVDAVFVHVCAAMVGGEKKEMLAVGKKAGPAVGAVKMLVESCEALGIGLMRMNDPQGVAIVRSVDDGVVGAPCAAAGIWCVGDRSDGAAGDRNGF